ncbi:hypothetical protein KJ766_00350, partial [Patescibacteria group bacterium]|nr:hypothetical protein [Patescibacteria group bacterium]
LQAEIENDRQTKESLGGTGIAVVMKRFPMFGNRAYRIAKQELLKKEAKMRRISHVLEVVSDAQKNNREKEEFDAGLEGFSESPTYEGIDRTEMLRNQNGEVELDSGASALDRMSSREREIGSTTGLGSGSERRGSGRIRRSRASTSEAGLEELAAEGMSAEEKGIISPEQQANREILEKNKASEEEFKKLYLDELGISYSEYLEAVEKSADLEAEIEDAKMTIASLGGSGIASITKGLPLFGNKKLREARTELSRLEPMMRRYNHVLEASNSALLNYRAMQENIEQNSNITQETDEKTRRVRSRRQESELGIRGITK